MQRFWLWLARQRTVVQVLSALTLNSYFTQHTTKGFPCPALNCYACPAAAFSCPIGNIQNFILERRFPLYVAGVVGLVGALAGRASCGWLCPFGWLQELVYKIPVPKLRLRNRFNWTRYVVLGVLVIAIPFLAREPWFAAAFPFITREPWFCKLCPAGMLEGGIPWVLLSAHLQELVGTFFWIKAGILGAFLAWMSVTRRPFCRWVCPLGALWSPFNPVSAFRLRVDQEACTQCNHCQEVCPVDIRVHENPNAGACIRCLACIRECPGDCISVTSPGWSVEADRAGTPGAA